MKLKPTKIFLLFLVSFAFLSCAQNSNTSLSEEQQTINYITAEELQARIDTIQLIDIRTPEEYNSGHLKNAININFFDADFADQINKLDKNKEVYLYCKSGNRSGKASKKLKDSGFLKIYDMNGGILEWNQKNLETVK